MAMGIEKGNLPRQSQLEKVRIETSNARIISFLLAVFRLIEENPIISIDTKKKEVLGELTGNDAVLTKGKKAVPVFDHDYPHLGTGKAIPHGIYDVKLNQGYLSLGKSHETAEFVVDNLEWW